MKTIRITARAVCVALFAVAFEFGAQGANLFSDPSFEQPVTGPGGLNFGYTAFGVGQTIGGAWTVVGTSGPHNHVALVPDTQFGSGVTLPAQDGSQWLDLTGEWDNGAAVGVAQTLSTVSGQEYSLSFYVGAITTAGWFDGNAVVNVLLNGSPLQTAINSDPSGNSIHWKQFTCAFTATGSGTTVAFMNGSTVGVGLNGLDAVTIVAVPEPGTLSLLAFGFGSLRCLLRRPRD